MATQDTILLSRFQFAHLRDRNTGKLTLIEGPSRIQLESNQELVSDVQSKISVSDGQFAIVVNPFSAEKNDIVEGEREVRIGPTVFSLHPGEAILGKVQNEFVLTDTQALLLRAEKECPSPLEPDATIPAGTKLLLKGPRRFIPHKNIRILEEVKSLSLSENEGVFVQNDDTGAVRLVRGPTDFFLAHNESFWDKELTAEEEEALGFAEPEEEDEDNRILAATPRPRKSAHEAIVIDLEDHEAICLFDGDRRRVEFGPKKIFVEPHERPRILHISGGVPVRPNALRIATLALGPDFIRDRLTVRTRDNALLTLEITIRWQFRVDEAEPHKLFALKDFVGFAAQTISSEIREAAAKHDFETFHSGAAAIVKAALFGEEGTERVFEQNGLVILGIDVESVTPEDQEIAAKLTQTIKTTVDIVTTRQQQEARLESERRLIEGQAKNEKERTQLIKLETGNERRRLIENTKAKAEAAKLQAESEAEAIRIKSKAETEAVRQRLQAEADIEKARLTDRATVFGSDGGKQLIELARAEALKATDKLIVPADTKLVLGLDRVVGV